MIENTECPLCGDNQAKKSENAMNSSMTFRCRFCGNWNISLFPGSSFFEVIKEPINRAKIRNYVYRHQSGIEHTAPSLSTSDLEMILRTDLPDTREQQDNLILYIGNKIPSHGHTTEDLNHREMLGPIGAVDSTAVSFLIDHLCNMGFLSGIVAQSMSGTQLLDATLSMDGWERYESLKKKHSSKRVFMAMQFGQEDLDSFYKDHLKKALSELGYELFRVDETPCPGLIDNTIRIAIRASRFIIADLTAQNRGAYWEAGFAEGEGKKVFYTCHERDFKEIHFDTSHHYTVKWSEETIAESLKELQSMILSEFFDEFPKDKIDAYLSAVT